ncbi:unnamed protein product [Caenorhabditis nigoni]|uniref:Integrase catalytic domain-containing protein n=1 Tax=Caenorhabditis nigoni TaxID=1611254 RepID=A0A2G5SAZ2_9PELO|nr:hypothetical protein B9Z55_028852 [Caenorhabditis nigoni]PIC12076.1 hypothetical protein B9Z55_028639 [Caenorhabditis nigoni]
MENLKLLEKLYHDPKFGLRGPAALLYQARKINKNITRKEVVSYLHSNDAYTRHFPQVRRIQHNPWVANGPDSHHMADLAMLPTLKKKNSGFCYILVVVDVFSRYVFVRPLKNKECSTVTKAYEDILYSSWRIPSRLYTDKGTEFMGKIFRNFVQSVGISHMNPKNTNVKACYAENAIMRIKNKLEKWFTVSKDYRWVEILNEIVDGLNGTYMDSIGTCPKNVNWKNAQKVYNRLYGSVQSHQPRYKIGNTVRILLENSPFVKGTRAKWTEEIFKVIKVIPYDIPVYILADDEDREVDGIWYEEEMVLYNPTDG